MENAQSQLDTERASELAQLYQRERHLLIDTIQKLTFFVVGFEGIFCGYLLLYADRLKDFKFGPFLFLISAIAATSGIFWRYCYNIDWHESSYGRRTQNFVLIIRKVSYWIYISLTFIFLIAIIIIGFIYLINVAETTSMSEKEAVSKLESVLDNEQAPVYWGQIQEAMKVLHRTKSPRCLEIMARILDRKTAMVLAEGSLIPSTLPPLEISQMLAINILVQMKSTEQLERIRAVYRRTTFLVLRERCRLAITELGGTIEIDTGDT